MNHTPHLANDLVIQSLIAKIEKLTLRVEALEGARRKPRALLDLIDMVENLPAPTKPERIDA